MFIACSVKSALRLQDTFFDVMLNGEQSSKTPHTCSIWKLNTCTILYTQLCKNAAETMENKKKFNESAFKFKKNRLEYFINDKGNYGSYPYIYYIIYLLYNI